MVALFHCLLPPRLLFASQIDEKLDALRRCCKVLAKGLVVLGQQDVQRFFCFQPAKRCVSVLGGAAKRDFHQRSLMRESQEKDAGDPYNDEQQRDAKQRHQKKGRLMMMLGVHPTHRRTTAKQDETPKSAPAQREKRGCQGVTCAMCEWTPKPCARQKKRSAEFWTKMLFARNTTVCLACRTLCVLHRRTKCLGSTVMYTCREHWQRLAQAEEEEEEETVE